MTRMELQNTTQSVAERVWAALKSIDRSGRWLARQLNENHAWVHRRLSGEVEFSTGDLKRVAAILAVPASTLLDEPALLSPERRAS